MNAPADKAFKTLQALAALEGMSCTRTAAENIILARGAASWTFGSVLAAQRWLERLEQPSTEVPA